MTPLFFYGWIIVAISMLAGFFSAGVSNITMAVVLWENRGVDLRNRRGS